MVYRFYNIPGVTPRDIINKKLSDMPGFFRQITEAAEARGPEITVDFADGTDPDVRTLGTTTHICTSFSTEFTRSWSTWYRVTSVIEIAPATSTQGRTWRLTATLAALQTVVTNSLETWTADGVTRRLIDAQRWELNRAGVPDPSQTSEGAVAACHRYRYLATTYDLSAFTSMVACVTAYPQALVNLDQVVLWGETNNLTSVPQTYALCGSNGSLLYGSNAIKAIGRLVERTETRPMIYRIQLCPYNLLTDLSNSTYTFKDDGDPSTTRIYGRFVKSSLTGVVIAPDVSFLSGKAYSKAYGDPIVSYEYAGNVLGKFSLNSLSDPEGRIANVTATFGVIASMGLTLYLRFMQDGETLGLSAVPLPELIGSSDGLLSWYETTGRNLTASAWQSTGQTATMAGSGVALGLIAGGPIGAAVGAAVGAGVSIASTWASTERQLEQGARQASQTLHTVGSGPANLYAATSAHNFVGVYLETISPEDEDRLEMYFRRNGYGCAIVRDNLTTLDRQNFESFAGSGTFSIWADQAPDVTVDYNDLHDRANAELSAGVTVWSTSSIGNYSVSNDPVN